MMIFLNFMNFELEYLYVYIYIYILLSKLKILLIQKKKKKNACNNEKYCFAVWEEITMGKFIFTIRMDFHFKLENLDVVIFLVLNWVR